MATGVGTDRKPVPVTPRGTEEGTTPAKPPAGGPVAMSDLLDQAGTARRAGDLVKARELYQRVLQQSANNVEANGGLGDVARAQGDLNAAKASYERALASSPSYGPAQLGLADTEWELGNKAGARNRYAQIVERLGDRAPERARQRGTANAE
jgi:tetratricopeptide (TPR) repeat protein